jgi:LPXTG-site transpeptidase (sortase) family protein
MKKLLTSLIFLAASATAAFGIQTRSYVISAPQITPVEAIVVRDNSDIEVIDDEVVVVGTGTAIMSKIVGTASAAETPAPDPDVIEEAVEADSALAVRNAKDEIPAAKAEAVAVAEVANAIPAPSVTQAQVKNPDYPVRLIVPSIGLDAPIEYMDVNAKGEMDVPDGSTKNVGWYEDGTIPGNTGSAVIAAHVYAIFSKLKHVIPGSDIYIVTKENTKLHFVVDETKTHDLGKLSSEFLFNRNDDKRLNLITCAGTFIPSLDTYDQRFVVYAKLVS